LGPFLADHVLVEDVLDLGRPGDAQLLVARLLLVDLLGDDVVAQTDALIADVDGRAGDELLHLLLRLSAEGAAQRVVLALVYQLLRLPGSARASARPPPSRNGPPFEIGRASCRERVELWEVAAAS